MATEAFLQRLWAGIDKTSSPDGCWLWMKATNGGSKGGYGLVFLERYTDENGIRRQRFGRVHIVVYELLVGPVPEGAVLDHVWQRCRNRNCCNPAHLEPVTLQVNQIRARERNQKVCPKWHPRTPESTEVLPSGWLRCLICKEETRLRQLERARERRRLAREERARSAAIRREVGGSVALTLDGSSAA